jgi:hypothetical protein
MMSTPQIRIIAETKIFDPADGFGAIKDAVQVTDSSVVKRGDQWWMCLAGRVWGREAIQLFSASLPPGAPLSARGWTIHSEPGAPEKTAMLATQERSASWDLKGGRHCPAYVKGYDPARGAWVERVYYAGGAENLMGPYTIGYLEWDAERWRDQPAPVFVATEEWEHGSVYEPNLIFVEEKWRMWYVAGGNAEDYLVQGYSESADGRTGWSDRKMVFAPDEKVFDFNIAKSNTGYEAVFSRVHVSPTAQPSPKTGLWWCRSDSPSPNIADWSEPIQLMTAEDKGWHTGPWRPSLQFSETDPARRLVFFDGIYRKNEPGPFPFNFTLGCLEFEVR